MNFKSLFPKIISSFILLTPFILPNSLLISFIESFTSFILLLENAISISFLTIAAPGTFTLNSLNISFEDSIFKNCSIFFAIFCAVLSLVILLESYFGLKIGFIYLSNRFLGELSFKFTNI